MDIKKTFGTNKEKEEKGVWVKGPDGAEFLIARANNKGAEKLTTELMRPHRKLARMGRLPENVQREITISVLARAILIDWRGVTDNGVPVAYTPEVGEKTLRDVPDFADFVAGYATEAANFQDEDKEERLGNSSSASSGT